MIIDTVSPDTTDPALWFAMRVYDLFAEQKDEEAERLLDYCLKLEPTLTSALCLKGVLALSRGDYATGLPLWELRNQQIGAERWHGNQYAERPYWNGKPTKKTMLLHYEAGFGDTIQMLRYIPMVKERCPDLLVELQPGLVKLVQENFLDVEVVATGARKRDFTYHYPITSLPFRFNTRTGTIPPCPYLKAPAVTPVDGLKIGLAWKSSSIPTVSRLARQMTDEQIEQLGKEFDFRSLQYEHNTWENFWESAQTVMGLDLIITVDTSLAHLAGAFGKPVWLLLSMDCDHRWMRKRSDTPWYPSMRLFRQHRRDDWAGVLDDVAIALGVLNASPAFLPGSRAQSRGCSRSFLRSISALASADAAR